MFCNNCGCAAVKTVSKTILMLVFLEDRSSITDQKGKRVATECIGRKNQDWGLMGHHHHSTFPFKLNKKAIPITRSGPAGG